ncbi:hypothetical protein LTS18_002775 [Coniosporium uncinatum]|uniref:Uncharacterized protein n=1 Tax=Coniosporium uncinatum TaxID=93489 RepID=A0ACC3DU23_9PEZI|nr:hypothetical protein LTS18_002775 [Coniosporium uncinatum]
MWGVYLLTLEKPGCGTRIYVGSGTDKVRGVVARLWCYDNGVTLPLYVDKALRDGFTIVRKGLLCWIPLPSASEIPAFRALFLVLETAFTFSLWTMRSKSSYGFDVSDTRPWTLDALQYDGLCTHSPLSEGPLGDFDLTTQELEEMAIQHMEHRAEYIREWRRKAKAADPASYKVKAIKNRRNYLENHPGAQKVADKRSQAKAKARKTHYCSVCDHASIKRVKLTKHLAGPKHAAKAAGVPLHPKKTHYCSICDHVFPRAAELRRHYESQSHKTKATKAASKATKLTAVNSSPETDV